MDESGISLNPPLGVFDKLNAGLSQRLTLIVAPEGSGKSALLQKWLSTSRQAGNQPAAWLIFRICDNEPTCFLDNTIAALQAIHIEGLEDVLSNHSDEFEQDVTCLVNILSFVPFDFSLILDNYHLITALSIHRGVRFLLDYQPPQMHLFIASRQEPPLQIAKLCARRQLVEIGPVVSDG